ncbi:MAG: hypothetical protein E7508_10890 [Ruminococcus sp.]|nr:hypothetical protein [Ruminococcus sp.]
MNEQNLIPFSKRTESEQREIRSKGGKASGRKRSMKAIAKSLAQSNVADDEIIKLLDMFGIKDRDFQTVMIFMQMLKASKEGDTAAFKAIVELLGEDIRHEELALKKKELKLKEASIQKNTPEVTEEPMLYKALMEDDE